MVKESVERLKNESIEDFNHRVLVSMASAISNMPGDIVYAPIRFNMENDRIVSADMSMSVS